MYCTQCGEKLSADMKFCFSCGHAVQNLDDIPQQRSESSEETGESVNEQIVDVEEEESDPEPNTKSELYSAVIGETSLPYYKGIFYKFDTEARAGESWNWPAFFVTFYWMLYRKMWGPAALYFLAGVVLTALVSLIPADSRGGVTFVDLIYLIGGYVILPIYANAIYYKHCRDKITDARFKYSDPYRQLSYLRRLGGTSSAPFVVLAILASLMILGIVASIAIPAYA